MTTSDLKQHKHHVVLSRHLHVQVHGSEFNAATARWISDLLSSMNFFWACVALDVLAVPGLALAVQAALGSHNLGALLAVIGVLVVFAAQTVIQLLALPALGAYAKLNQQMQDAQATAQGQTLTAIHGLVSDVHTINEQQTAMLTELHARVFPQRTTATGGATNALPPAT